MTAPVSQTPMRIGFQPQTAEAQREALRGAARQFEAVFLRQMIGSMRQARLAEDPLSSQATEQFRDMGDAQLADAMSEQGAFGIAQMLLAQFDRQVPPPATGAAPANDEGTRR